MNASRTDAIGRQAAEARFRPAGRRRLLASRLSTCALLLLATACSHTTPTSGFDLLGATALPEPLPPTQVDRAVVDLIASAFVGSKPGMDAALARVATLHDEDAIEQAREDRRPAMEGLVPLCVDLKNSTLDDPVAYREASKQLLDSWTADLDPALEARRFRL